MNNFRTIRKLYLASFVCFILTFIVGFVLTSIVIYCLIYFDLYCGIYFQPQDVHKVVLKSTINNLLKEKRQEIKFCS